jgi:2-keto-3-deoxy-L-rhamnonate aldolase RhmA
MTVYANHAKRRLAAGKLTLGMVLHQARTVDIAAIAKSCGFDFLSVDMEHGTFDVDVAAQIVNAALPVGITSLVRVPGKEHHHATRMLDAGAQGIIVPHVDNSEDARIAVSYCKFAPLGRRSGSLLPQAAYAAMPRAELAQQINEETLLAIMVESPKGIDSVDAIAAVPGVDVVLIGTNDLCAEMGIPGQFHDKRLEEAYRKVIAACRKHAVAPGMSGLHDPELIQKFIGLGMRYVVGGTDISFLMTAARERTRFLRGLVEEQ